MFKRKLLTAVALSVAVTSAFAGKAEPLTPYAGTLPAALQFAATQGALAVFKKFPAAGGLDGWVVKERTTGKDLVVFTSKDGEVLVAGMMLDKTGKNLSAAYTEANVPAPDYTVALNEFKAAPGVTVGNPKAKAEILVLFDANCGYCKVLHKLTDSAVAAGELKIRYVPVAILGADSDIKAAGILASKNPAAAIANDVLGGKPETSNDKGFLAKAMSNTALMKKHGFTGTPGVLYFAKGQGGEPDTVYSTNGVPNVTEMYTRLGVKTQLLDKLKTDPQLGRFVR